MEISRDILYGSKFSGELCKVFGYVNKYIPCWIKLNLSRFLLG